MDGFDKKTVWVVLTADNYRLKFGQHVCDEVAGEHNRNLHWTSVYAAGVLVTENHPYKFMSFFYEGNTVKVLGDAKVAQKLSRDQQDKARDVYTHRTRPCREYIKRFGNAQPGQLGFLQDDEALNEVCLVGDIDDWISGSDGCSVLSLKRLVERLVSGATSKGCRVGFILDDRKAPSLLISMLNVSMPIHDMDSHMSRTCYHQHLLHDTNFVSLHSFDDAVSRDCSSRGAIRLIGVTAVSHTDPKYAGVWFTLLVDGNVIGVICSGVNVAYDTESNKLMLKVLDKLDLVDAICRNAVEQANDMPGVSMQLRHMMAQTPREGENVTNPWSQVIAKVDSLCVDPDTLTQEDHRPIRSRRAEPELGEAEAFKGKSCLKLKGIGQRLCSKSGELALSAKSCKYKTS